MRAHSRHADRHRSNACTRSTHACTQALRVRHAVLCIAHKIIRHHSGISREEVIALQPHLLSEFLQRQRECDGGGMRRRDAQKARPQRPALQALTYVLLILQNGIDCDTLAIVHGGKMLRRHHSTECNGVDLVCEGLRHPRMSGAGVLVGTGADAMVELTSLM